MTLVIKRHPPPSLNTVLGWHWRYRSRHTRTWHEEVWAAWFNAGRPTFTRPRITIRLYTRGDRAIHDYDNRVGSTKVLVDALKGHAITDDAEAVIGQPMIEAAVDNRRPRVEIELTETAGPAPAEGVG